MLCDLALVRHLYIIGCSWGFVAPVEMHVRLKNIELGTNTIKNV